MSADCVFPGRDLDRLMAHKVIWAGSPDAATDWIAHAATEPPFNLLSTELNHGFIDRAELSDHVTLLLPSPFDDPRHVHSEPR